VGTVPLHDAADPDVLTRVVDDLATAGVSAARNVLGAAEVAELSQLVDRAVEEDATVLPEERREHEYGRVVFLPRYHRRFLDLLDLDGLMDPCDRVLGSDATLYTMTTACQPAGGPGRSMHVDTGIAVPGYTIGLGLFVLLDDFTPESGPTRFYPVDTIEPPDHEEFVARALRLEAPAGSACWFRGRLWHDALPNTTDRWRRCVILALVRPWIRQRFDMARMVPFDTDGMSPRIRQKLGFDLIAPGSYDEYYLPAEQRRATLLDIARRP
jgi:hypothetical protein